MRFTYTYENEIGRQIVKAPQAAAIRRSIVDLISPTLPMKECMTLRVVTARGSFTFPLDTELPSLGGHPSHVKVKPFAT